MYPISLHFLKGFFYVSRHGLESACDAALEASRQFFALTYATKTALENVHSPAFRGYGARHRQ